MFVFLQTLQAIFLMALGTRLMVYKLYSQLSMSICDPIDHSNEQSRVRGPQTLKTLYRFVIFDTGTEVSTK